MLDKQKIASDTEVQSEVRQWFGQRPASFFALGIQQIIDREKNYLKKVGRYVEK